MAKKVTTSRGRKPTSSENLGIEENQGVDFANIFDTALGNVAKKSGKDVSEFDGNLNSALVGIPLNYFALECMFMENVMGLGRMICLDGLPASCKSSMMWELARLMYRANGFSCVVDTEQKATENLGQGIVGYDAWPNIKFVSPETFEESMMVISSMTEIMEKTAKKNGKKFPMFIGLDSAQGSLAESEMGKIDKEGAAGRSFPLPALLASKYLPYITSKISKLPILFAVVRHCRKEQVQNVTVTVAKGANSYQFFAYATFMMAKDGPDLNMANCGGRNIKIQLKKGTGEGMNIPVYMKWRDEIIQRDAGDVESRRHIVFDWPRAAFTLLTAPAKCKVPLRVQKGIKDLLGAMNPTAGKVNCKPLGLDKATPEELHQALYDPQNINLLAQLRAVFNIRVGQAFKRGDDFDELKAKQRAIVMARRPTEFKVEDDDELNEALDQQLDVEDEEAVEADD